MRRRVKFGTCFIVATLAAFPQMESRADDSQASQPPLTYRDPESGILFFVESDRRHVAAINREGRVLWDRDPFVDGHLKPYRVAFPEISYVGEIPSWAKARRERPSIGIGFNSSQFGLLDIETGGFTFVGQD